MSKAIRRPRAGSMSLMGAYGTGAIYLLLAIGSVWFFRFASQLYDIILEKDKK